jgi:mannose-6-phosphate isomerase-like protein (cupin superfamily)
MTFVDLQRQDPYEPPGHDGVLNRLLAGAAMGTSEVSIWHGVLQPGGGSDEHVHADSAQIYVGLTGTCSVTVESETHELRPMTAVTIGRGVQHRIRNEGETESSLLVVSAPALR